MGVEPAAEPDVRADGWWRASDGEWYPPRTDRRPAKTEGNSSKAIAALVLGLLGFLNTIMAIAAVVLGFQARAEIRRSGGRLQGARMALVGIIFGLLWTLGAVVLGFFWFTGRLS